MKEWFELGAKIDAGRETKSAPVLPWPYAVALQQPIRRLHFQRACPSGQLLSRSEYSHNVNSARVSPVWDSENDAPFRPFVFPC